MKGANQMNTRKVFLIPGLMALLFLLIPCAHLWAGGGGPEPVADGAIIQGPEIWGAVIFRCNPFTNDVVAMHVKRVVNCNVQTHAVVDYDWQFDCPAAPEQAINQGLPAGSQFWDIEGTPFINKTRNFLEEVDGDTTVVSFDAQFKFWLPGTP